MGGLCMHNRGRDSSQRSGPRGSMEASSHWAIGWLCTLRDIDLLDASAGVNVYLRQRPGPRVDELVGYSGRCHLDLAGAHLYGLVADSEGSVTLQRYEDLLVRMGVQYRSTAGGLSTRKNDTSTSP